MSGVYAAGDICVKNLRQVVTAVSDGAVAATSLEKYLGTLYRQLGVKRDYVRKAPPKAPQQEAEAPKAASGAYLDDDIRQCRIFSYRQTRPYVSGNGSYGRISQCHG